MAGLQILAVDLVITPLPEGLDPRSAVVCSRLQFVGAFPALFADPGFLFIEPGELQQGRIGDGVAAAGLLEVTPGVSPALGM